MHNNGFQCQSGEILIPGEGAHSPHPPPGSGLWSHNHSPCLLRGQQRGNTADLYLHS